MLAREVLFILDMTCGHSKLQGQLIVSRSHRSIARWLNAAKGVLKQVTIKHASIDIRLSVCCMHAVGGRILVLGHDIYNTAVASCSVNSLYPGLTEALPDGSTWLRVNKSK
jgi:hypothetical protein